jgi:hypothetical protein
MVYDAIHDPVIGITSYKERLSQKTYQVARAFAMREARMHRKRGYPIRFVDETNYRNQIMPSPTREPHYMKQVRRTRASRVYCSRA